jgi:Vps23 core domain
MSTSRVYLVCSFFRLLNAFAEEQATEDAIYYMGEALRKGVIELDVFLKVCVLCINLFTCMPDDFFTE